MHDALAGREPLHVAAAEARGRAERIGMVGETLANDGDRLEAAMRMRREARHLLAVVHAPAVLAPEVLADVAPRQRGVGAEAAVALGVRVVVVDAEQERVGRLPGEAELLDLEDGAVGHGGLGNAADSGV